MEEFFAFASKLTAAGGTVVILAFVYLLVTGKFRLEREVTEKDRRISELTIEKDEWKSMAIANNRLAERSTSIGEQNAVAAAGASVAAAKTASVLQHVAGGNERGGT